MPTKPLQQKVTKPKQAGSSRSLDRWQREVMRMLELYLDPPYHACPKCKRHWGMLQRLLRSMQKAERR